jgi:acyl-CoA synthetase (AMP-forming)/AMP-acid ligase II
MSHTPLFDVIHGHSVKSPNNIAIISDKNVWTYYDLIQYVNKMVIGLCTKFEPISDKLRVVAVCEQPHNTLLLALALAKLNGTLIPLNFQSPKTKILEAVNATNANLLVTDSNNVCSLISSQTPCISIQELMLHIDNDYKIQSDATNSFIISMSSGSTGNPKPIVISQQAKLARAYQSIQLYNITANDVVLNASPFFHSLGQRLSFVPLVAGATLVYLKHFTPTAWIKLVNRYLVTFTIPVASHLYALESVWAENVEKLSSLRCLVTSSAPIDVNFKKQMQEDIGCEFHEIYGASEVASATNLSPEDFPKKYMTVGNPIQGVRIKILDENRCELETGLVGEIAILSSLRFTEYYKLPELTESSFAEGYFLTGDLGFLDKDGFLTYVSRKKDVIISGGINIYPAEIEKCLMTSALIQQVCVIGVEDKLLGEVVLAICVGSEMNELKLRKIANSELLSYQRPIAYFFVSELPLTASGKVDKLSLRAIYNALNRDWTAPLRAIIYHEN